MVAPVRPGIHVQHPVPHLIAPIESEPATAREQCRELDGRGVEDQCRHTLELNDVSGGVKSTLSTHLYPSSDAQRDRRRRRSIVHKPYETPLAAPTKSTGTGPAPTG